MRYAKIIDGVVVSVGARPNWRTDEGEPVTDARLAEDGYLPVVDVPPEYDADAGLQIEAPFADWAVGETSVEAAYVVESFSPEVARANRAARVVVERARRLALGFDYDFGDGRGVHRIGQTAADLAGWSEVTTAAQTAINLGSTTPIGIVTDTGPVEVTPLEWQAILAAATAYRQPIWAASFALQAMSPIPADFADDSYWP
jgi:hypothetical protein